jgi:glutamyl-tRNA synthetase
MLAEGSCCGSKSPIRTVEEEFVDAAIEDLRWMGFEWTGEPCFQSQRRHLYLEAWRRLKNADVIYPCRRSRREISSLAPHEEEPVFPVEWRADDQEALGFDAPDGVNWRFRVPDGETISFRDQNFGLIEKTTLRDFGDFLVWNRDGIPAYELAVVVDDIAMGITEVVRGADLLRFHGQADFTLPRPRSRDAPLVPLSACLRCRRPTSRPNAPAG